MSPSIRGLWFGCLILTLISASEAQAQTKRALAPKQVKLPVFDDVQVRTRLLPQSFDEKGNPRKLTKEEVKELRGNDSKLPGYAADYSDLKAGQAVLIYLGRVKTTTPKERSKGDEPAKSTQSWEPAGQLAARLVKIEGPEFSKSKPAPKGKASDKTIPRQISFTVSAIAVPALHDLSAVVIEILDDRITR
jgi:hypothetical protein